MEEINGWTPPLIYDLSSDKTRIATQADIDHLVDIARAYGQLVGIYHNMGGVINCLSRK